METEKTTAEIIKRINRRSFRIFVKTEFGDLARISRKEAKKLIEHQEQRGTPEVIRVNFDPSMGDGREIVYILAGQK